MHWIPLAGVMNWLYILHLAENPTHFIELSHDFFYFHVKNIQISKLNEQGSYFFSLNPSFVPLFLNSYRLEQYSLWLMIKKAVNEIFDLKNIS